MIRTPPWKILRTGKIKDRSGKEPVSRACEALSLDNSVKNMGGMSMETQHNETYLRLAKPRAKGLMGVLSLVFSRLLVIVLLILAQIAIYVAIFLFLSEFMPHFVVVEAVFVFFVLMWLFNTGMDSTAKLTWMFFIAVVPILGAMMLMFTQLNLGQRKLSQRSATVIEETKHAIPQPEGAWEKIKDDPAGTDDLTHWLNRSGCFPIYDKTEVTYFPLGEDKFEAMLEELRKAEKYIFMEYFIIEEGFMWGSILEILIEKAKAGVDVRVMYDGMCEISNLPSNYVKLLRDRGIRARSYAPIKPFLSSHYNYRDHRKILVVDGKVAFNGGVNLGDEYINREERFGHWKDTAVMLKGPAVRSFTLMFLQMWNLNDKRSSKVQVDDLIKQDSIGGVPIPKNEVTFFPEEELSLLDDEPPTPENTEPKGFVLPYCDCPLDKDKAGEIVYMDILNRASDYVYIMTPYLILDGELEMSLKYAAQRGVDVRLILPGIPDKKMAFALAKSHYAALTEAGVKIYEYTPGFVHAKVFLSDDMKAVVGTINLDYRSLYHHFECATYMYGTDCLEDIKADFQETLAKCRPVTEETIRNESAFYKVMGVVMKVIAPLM